MTQRALLLCICYTLFSLFCSAHAWAQEAPLVLGDGWEYRWGDSPFSNGTPAWTSEADDSAWKSLRGVGLPPGRKGEEIVWLRLRLPQYSNSDSTWLQFRADHLVQVYFEGKRLYSYGTWDAPQSMRSMGYPIHRVRLPDQFAGRKIFLRVFSNGSTIGLTRPPRMGSRDELVIEGLRGEVFQDIVVVVLGLVGALALCVWLAVPRAREYMAFSILSLAAAVYVFTRARFTATMFCDDRPLLFRLELFSLYILPIGYSWSCYYTFVHNRLHKYLGFGFLVYVVGTGLFAAGGGDLQKTLFPFQVAALFAIVASVVNSVWVASRKHRNAIIFILGLSCSLLVNFMDLLMATQIVSEPRTVVHWGFLALVGALSIILVLNYFDLQRERVAEVERREQAERTLRMRTVALAAQISDRLNSPLLVILNTIHAMERRVEEFLNTPTDANGLVRLLEDWGRTRAHLDNAVEGLQSLSGDLSHLRETCEEIEATSVISDGDLQTKKAFRS